MEQPWLPIPRRAITLLPGFWHEKTALIGQITIPHEYDQMAHHGQVDALQLDQLTHRGRALADGWFWGGSVFWDSDLAKWLEAAAGYLETTADPALDRLADEVIARFAAAQEADGYFNSHILTWRPNHRFKNLRDLHELYCAGHLIEAGVVHHEATGKTSLLNLVRKFADYLVSRFGPNPDQSRGYCGHPEIELALIRLYRLTGEKSYLDLARHFISVRGESPNFYDQEAVERLDTKPFRPDHPGSPYAYMQAHRPVREHDKVVGHAVRAMYLYSAVADLAIEDGDEELAAVCQKIWQDVCSTKMYVTGGIGSDAANEGFTSDYDLPNEHAYAETCASIGLFLFGYRLLRMSLNSKYGDVMELALYNSVLSGVGLDGKSFFYENPLASDGKHLRLPWPWWCPCCPPNLARFLTALRGYTATQREDEVALHLLVSGEYRVETSIGKLVCVVTSDLPYRGKVSIALRGKIPPNFRLAVRRPGWTDQVSWNRAPISDESGYLHFFGPWKEDDVIELAFSMPIRALAARYEVGADRGRRALSRGPLIYCLEGADNGPRIDECILSPDLTRLQTEWLPELFGGTMIIRGEAEREISSAALYSFASPHRQSFSFVAIPYFAWSNRAPGEMRVWLRSS